jgi:hypothetical protein
MRSPFARLLNRFSQLSPGLVAILAVVGIFVSIFFLLWSRVGTDLGDRANVSTAVATMFALFAAIAAVSSLVWVESSDYRAQQSVKADTARLRAALRSIMVKTAVLTQYSDKPDHRTCIDFKDERDAIHQFLGSTTAFGYWVWIEKRGVEARGVGKSNPWGSFFARFAYLLNECDANGMTVHAVQIEKFLASLRREDVHQISTDMTDLAGVLGTAKESTDTLLAGIAATYDRN